MPLVMTGDSEPDVIADYIGDRMRDHEQDTRARSMCFGYPRSRDRGYACHAGGRAIGRINQK
jgi:hypothetical protein